MAPAAPQPPPPAAVLRGHRSDVQCLAVLPRRLSQLARGGGGEGPAAAAAAASASGMDLLLASGDAGGEVRLWDLQQRRALFSRVLHDSQAGVLHLAVVGALGSGGPALLSQGRDGVVKAWPLLLGNEALLATAADPAAAADPSPAPCAAAAAALAAEPSLEVRGGCYSFCRFALAAVDRDVDDLCGSGSGEGEEGGEEGEGEEGGPAAAAEDDEAADEEDRFPPQTRAVGFRATKPPERGRAPHVETEDEPRALRPGLLKLALREAEEEDEEGEEERRAGAAAAEGEGGEGEGEDLTEAQELALVEGRRPYGPPRRGGGEHWLAMPAPDGTSVALWRLGEEEEQGAGGDDGGGAAAAAGASTPRAPARLLSQRERNAQGAPLHGMVMAVALLRPSSLSAAGAGRLHALVGYEDGVVGLWRCGAGRRRQGGGGGKGGGPSSLSSSSSSRLLSCARAHDEPVMCVAVLPPAPRALGPPPRPPGAAAPPQEEEEEEMRAAVSGAADDRLAVLALSLSLSRARREEGAASPPPHEALEPAVRLPMPRGGVAQVSAAWWRPPARARARASSSSSSARPPRRSRALVPVAAAAAWDGRVRVWALSGGQGEAVAAAPSPLAVLRHHGPPAAAAAVLLFTARGPADGGGGGDPRGDEGEEEEGPEADGGGGALWLASGGRDGTVAIWDALL